MDLLTRPAFRERVYLSRNELLRARCEAASVIHALFARISSYTSITSSHYVPFATMIAVIAAKVIAKCIRAGFRLNLEASRLLLPLESD